jgi:hypothetical protein
VALRTGIGFGPPLHRVTIEVLDSHGDRIGSETAPDWVVSFTNDTLDREIGGTEVYRFVTSEGIAVGHVPTGTYTIITNAVENEPGAPIQITRTSLLVKAEIDISTDKAVFLDARDAVPIGVSVPHKADKRNHSAAVIRELVGAGGAAFSLVALGAGWPLYATPAPVGELAPVGLFVSWTLAEPQPLQPLPWDKSGLCPTHPLWCYSDAPAYVYNLPILYRNGIPDNLHEQIVRPQLVEVPSRFHSDNPDAFVSQLFQSLPLSSVVAGFGDEVQIWFRPGKVTEYFLADDRITWLRVVRIERRPEGEPTQAINLFSDDRFAVAEAGARRTEERWHEAPVRMGVWDVREESLNNSWLIERWASASRNGPNNEWFTVPFQLMGNSRGHGGDLPSAATWRMWNIDTGTELEQTGLVFPLAPSTARYRLEQVVEYPPTLGLLTRLETTTWIFTSRPSDAHVPQRYKCLIQQPPRQDVCQIQPLIRLEYDLGLDINNRAPAGRTHQFTVVAGQHSKAVNRAPVTSLRVQASFDDGGTWRDARVVGEPKDTWDTGGFLPSAEPYQQFQVVLVTPPLDHSSGFVSLRVHAADANGGTVDQTIHRAYFLK